MDFPGWWTYDMVKSPLKTQHGPDSSLAPCLYAISAGPIPDTIRHLASPRIGQAEGTWGPKSSGQYCISYSGLINTQTRLRAGDRISLKSSKAPPPPRNPSRNTNTMNSIMIKTSELSNKPLWSLKCPYFTASKKNKKKFKNKNSKGKICQICTNILNNYV